jgi:carboxymethylenebutenolidase
LPNLYYWGRRIRCLILTVRLRERPLSELDVTRRWLAEQDRCTGKVGVIGFCMGGDFALMMAPRRGVSAASVNYGGATRDLSAPCPRFARLSAATAPKIGGRECAVFPIASESLLTAAGVEHDIKVYPDAGHGFLNDHEPAELPLWSRESRSSPWPATTSRRPRRATPDRRLLRYAPHALTVAESHHSL